MRGMRALKSEEGAICIPARNKADPLGFQAVAEADRSQAGSLARANHGALRVAAHRNWRAAMVQLLFCGDESPANDRATNGTPSSESFINLRGQFGLVSKSPLGLDLRVRHVTDGNPARRAGSHFVGNQAEYGVSHFGNVAESLKVEVIV